MGPGKSTLITQQRPSQLNPGDQKEHQFYMRALRKRVHLYGAALPNGKHADGVMGTLEWVSRYAYGVRTSDRSDVVLIPKHAVSFLRVLAE